MVKSTLKRQYSQALGKSTQVANKMTGGKGAGWLKTFFLLWRYALSMGAGQCLYFVFNRIGQEKSMGLVGKHLVFFIH